MERRSNFIDGAFATPAARTMTTTDPYTGEAWAEVDDDPAAVDVAVRYAQGRQMCAVDVDHGRHQPEHHRVRRGVRTVPAVMTFTDEAEVIALANDPRHGLAAGAWTDDVRRGHRVAASLDVGPFA